MKLPIRSQFIASPNMTYLAFDLSQAETWIVAHLANESRMIDALLNSDIHSLTASAIFHPHSTCSHPKFIKSGSVHKCTICDIEITKEQRYIGKKNNHGNSYQQGEFRMVESINGDSAETGVVVTLTEVKLYHKAWHSLYPNIKKWWKNIESTLDQNHRTLITPYGRKRTFFAQWGSGLFKEATAYIPQSTVGDHALGAIQPELNIPGGLLAISKLPDIIKYCRLVNTSHDSIMLECPINSTQDIAPQVYNLFHRPILVNEHLVNIPVDGEVGERWGELKPMPKEWLQ